LVETHTLRFLELVQHLVARNYRESHLGLENVRSLCALDVAYKGDLGVAMPHIAVCTAPPHIGSPRPVCGLLPLCMLLTPHNSAI